MKAVSIESLRAREPSLRDRISPLSCPPSSNTRHDTGSNSNKSKLKRDIGYLFLKTQWYRCFVTTKKYSNRNIPVAVVTNISYKWRIFKPLHICLNNIYKRRTYIFIFGFRFVFVNLYMVHLYSYCHLISPSQILSQLRGVLSTFSNESFYHLAPGVFNVLALKSATKMAFWLERHHFRPSFMKRVMEKHFPLQKF